MDKRTWLTVVGRRRKRKGIAWSGKREGERSSCACQCLCSLDPALGV